MIASGAEAVVRTKPRRIPELDALRGLVALLVVFHHLFVLFIVRWWAALPAPVYRAMDFIQARNKLAVLTFFVLSGYAIAMATRAAPPVTRAALGDYAFRRFARIVPLYILSLAWTAAMGLAYGSSGPAFSLRTLAGNAAFLQTSIDARGAWFEPFGRNGPYWSLSYEVFYYAILPLALLFAQRASAPRAAARLLGLGLAALATSLALNRLAPSPFSNFLGLWIVWLVGFVAFEAQRRRGAIALIAMPAIVIGAAAGVLTLTGRGSATLGDAFAGCLIGLVFALATRASGWPDRPVVARVRRLLTIPFERIGRGSYALYLLHYPLLLALQAWFAPAGALVTMSALVVVLAPFVLVACPWIERETGAMLRSGSARAPRRDPQPGVRR